jgi:hypothetical protein
VLLLHTIITCVLLSYIIIMGMLLLHIIVSVAEKVRLNIDTILHFIICNNVKIYLF